MGLKDAKPNRIDLIFLALGAIIFLLFVSDLLGTRILFDGDASAAVPEWPDYVDQYNGFFRYYGDNRRPGRKLHETVRGGNSLLRDVFQMLYADQLVRAKIPPFLVFKKTVNFGRSVRFLGLAAPGYPNLKPKSLLVAKSYTKDGQQFENYEALFSILDTKNEPIPREWLERLREGKKPELLNCPPAWRRFVIEGVNGLELLKLTESAF